MDQKERKESLLRQLSLIKSCLYRKPVPLPSKRIDHFGIVQETDFSKHEFPVKQVIWNPLAQLYASLDDKNLLLFDGAGSLKGSINFFKEAGIHMTSCFIHIQKFKVYVVISSDFKMLIYSEVLELLHKAKMSRTGSRVLAAYFLDSRNQLILVGISAVRILDFHIYPTEGNTLENDMTAKAIEVEQNHVLTIPTPIEWIRKSYFEPESQLIVLWDQNSVCLQSIVDENARIKYENIVQTTTVMEVLLIPEFKNFVAGMLTGEVYLFGYAEPELDIAFLMASTKANSSKKREELGTAEKRNGRVRSISPGKTGKMPANSGKEEAAGCLTARKVPRPLSAMRPASRKQDPTVQTISPTHIYTGHRKAVTALSPVSDHPTLFLSGSLDGTVCLWSLTVLFM